jgi:hypothetical protein
MKSQIEVESIANRVALHPFFAGMNRQNLTLLTDCAMVVHFVPGQLIFREGKLANRFYLIETGRVILESNGRRSNPVVSIPSARAISWAGRGFSHRTPGTLPRARWNRPPQSFSTARFSGSIASVIIRSL